MFGLLVLLVVNLDRKGDRERSVGLVHGGRGGKSALSLYVPAVQLLLLPKVHESQ